MGNSALPTASNAPRRAPTACLGCSQESQHFLSPDKPPGACLQCSEIPDERHEPQILFFFGAYFSYSFFAISSSPDERLSLVCTFFLPDHFFSSPSPSYRPDELQALVWLSFQHGLSPHLSHHLSISFSPDELQVLVWAVLLLQPFASTSIQFQSAPQPSLRSQSAQMSACRLSGLRIPLFFASLTISSSPDERSSLVWAIFLLDPSLIPPSPCYQPDEYKRSSGHLFNSALPFHHLSQSHPAQTSA